MENEERDIIERLGAATLQLERTLSLLEERQGAGEVERISATVEQGRREAELSEKLAAAEREIAELKASTLTGLSLEQRIAVKSQLMRAGAIA